MGKREDMPESLNYPFNTYYIGNRAFVELKDDASKILFNLEVRIAKEVIASLGGITVLELANYLKTLSKDEIDLLILQATLSQ